MSQNDKLNWLEVRCVNDNKRCHMCSQSGKCKYESK